MNEFITELIERLEEYYSENEFETNSGFIEVCLDIVNQLAEEYGKDTNVTTNILSELKKFLKEKFDYCTKQAGMYLEAECNSEIASYFRDRKELYLDRANIYGEVMRVIDRLAEEYNNDCCEWAQMKYLEFCLSDCITSCGHSEHYSTGIDKYCRHCGKKIKLVEPANNTPTWKQNLLQKFERVD